MSERFDEAKGKAKEGVGNLTDNERLEAEGRSEAAAAKAKRETKGVANQVKGNVKQGLGDLTDNERLEAEGAADRLKGEAQRKG